MVTEHLLGDPANRIGVTTHSLKWGNYMAKPLGLELAEGVSSSGQSEPEAIARPEARRLDDAATAGLIERLPAPAELPAVSESGFAVRGAPLPRPRPGRRVRTGQHNRPEPPASARRASRGRSQAHLHRPWRERLDGLPTPVECLPGPSPQRRRAHRIEAGPPRTQHTTRSRGG